MAFATQAEIPRFELFANTGVQVLELGDSVPRWSRDYSAPVGWQHCFCQVTQGGEPKALPYVQWQVVDEQFFLAVDTTLGEPQFGHVRADGHLTSPIPIPVRNLVAPNGKPIAGMPPLAIDVALNPGPRSGHANPVDLVIDFGNSRTGALLLELNGDRPHMQPFTLKNRYTLKDDERWFSSQCCWSSSPYQRPAEVEIEVNVYPRAPHRPLPFRPFSNLWRRPEPDVITETQVVQPRLFDDLSMLRMGRECQELTRLVNGNLLTGVSSPKRYLWADDVSWLENREWSMVTPYSTSEPRAYHDRLRGYLLAYIDSRDGDLLVNPPSDEFDYEYAATDPTEQHVPRTLMIAALYELICQAYAFANSAQYRERTVDRHRPRMIRSVTLSYPSGMIHAERERFRAQATKAVRIFYHTLGKKQGPEPYLALDFDEATAVQLAYIWGELEMVGHDPRPWFSVVGRRREAPVEAQPAAADGTRGEPLAAGLDAGFPHAPAPTESVAMDFPAERESWEDLPPPLPGDYPPPGDDGHLTPGTARASHGEDRDDDDYAVALDDGGITFPPANGDAAAHPEDPPRSEGPLDNADWPHDQSPAAAPPGTAPRSGNPSPILGAADGPAALSLPGIDDGPRDVRIASIDIGGGTSDLMIATYHCQMEAGVAVTGQVLHRDGISIAGDHLVERLLEELIVPAFAKALGLNAQRTCFLFGPENPNNTSLRIARVNWLSRLLLPLARKYLECAVNDDRLTRITHYTLSFDEARVVDEDVRQSFLNVLQTHPLTRDGVYNWETEMDLHYDPRSFEEIARRVFGELLTDFCQRIVEHQADIVLLAGQPTKLAFLQRYVRGSLPLHESRVISMYGHYAGSWYPYQDPGAPGVIVDPKSAVVVGAALGFATRRARLPQFAFEIRNDLRQSHVERYHWGVINPSGRILDPYLWFDREDETRRITRKIRFPRTIIGRKLYASQDAEPAPIYALEVYRRHDNEVIDLDVEVERLRNPADPGEEMLRLTAVRGTVGDRPAVLNQNVELKVRTLTDKRFYLDVGGLFKINTDKLAGIP